MRYSGPVTTTTPGPGGELLSSRLTFLHKVVLPAAWLGVFGVGTLVLLLRPEQDRQRALAFIVALVVGAFTFWNWGFPLKKVVATDDGLLVSNFRREAFVPWGQIVAIRESKIVNTITVELGASGAWGTRIVFRPYPARGVLASHPAVVLMSERANAARRGG